MYKINNQLFDTASATTAVAKQSLNSNTRGCLNHKCSMVLFSIVVAANPSAANPIAATTFFSLYAVLRPVLCVVLPQIQTPFLLSIHQLYQHTARNLGVSFSNIQYVLSLYSTEMQCIIFILSI